MTAGELATPPPGPEAAVRWVETHLADLVTGPVEASEAFRGGQSAAHVRLATFEVTGYAARRNEVWPEHRRGASRLSPYIRHGLIDLPMLWRHVSGGPTRDVTKYRDELLWQEYSRHLYARLGPALGVSPRFSVTERTPRGSPGMTGGWSPALACLDGAVTELERDGWLPNQERMWLAAHWTVRQELGWRDGEDLFFQHLLDGSRAANRLGWAWTVGAGTGKPYGFSRWQVEKRAPGLCDQCQLNRACPIEDWPDAPTPRPVADPDSRLNRDPDARATAGPVTPVVIDEPEAVWLTAESLGDDDPALTAHPDIPAVFVFDVPLLARLRLDSKRLVFLTETLADLASRRDVQLWRGDPATVLIGQKLAATYAPVPGWRSRAAILAPVAVHPWRWLVRPHGGAGGSFSAWRKAAKI